MNKNKIFMTSVKIWFKQFTNMIGFLVIAFTLLLIAINILDLETIQLYNTAIKIIIICFGYSGILIGANKIFREIRRNKAFIFIRTKYLIMLYQVILYIGFAFYCIAYKQNIYFFLAGYLSIFWQLFINGLYIKFNNKKYPLEENKEEK